MSGSLNRRQGKPKWPGKQVMQGLCHGWAYAPPRTPCSSRTKGLIPQPLGVLAAATSQLSTFLRIVLKWRGTCSSLPKGSQWHRHKGQAPRLGSSYLWRAIAALALRPCRGYCSSAPLSPCPASSTPSGCWSWALLNYLPPGKSASQRLFPRGQLQLCGDTRARRASLGWRTTWTPAVLFVGSVLCVGGVGLRRNFSPRCVCLFIYLFHSMSVYQMPTVCQSLCWLCLHEIYGLVVNIDIS